MHLFISYARVDKSYCQQIVDTLDIHRTWYDHRLHVGQKWWDEILLQLSSCEGLVYLISPESVISEYCQKEVAIAEQLGKHIFPVLIHSTVTIPASMQNIQYADLSKGLDGDAVKRLLSAIHVAERAADRAVISNIPPDVTLPPTVNPITVIDQAAEALETGNYDRAVFLLRQARDNGYQSRFIDIPAMLQKAEAALERQAYLREAEREYRPIAVLMKRSSTFKLGSNAFRAFHQYYPDYDPENLASVSLENDLPVLEWCEIPSGEVRIEQNKKKLVYLTDFFRMGKYPITNQQYQKFIDALDGYHCNKSWVFSPEAAIWHRDHPIPPESSTEGEDFPRTNINWYEASAFCGWLSDKTGSRILLPTQQQWLRAAQGDLQFQFPWGNRFDKTRCNTLEGGRKKITVVKAYEDGNSPFGVYDMAGNIWEWCGNKVSPPTGIIATTPEVNYAVHGGCFTTPQERARNGFYCKLKPGYRYHSIGFRIACLD